MNTFVKSIQNQEARTANGMKARQSSASALVDLFYAIGSSRKTDITPKFVAAFVENPELAGRLALWARDARGGAGERETFRRILRYCYLNDPNFCNRLIAKTPELGRWDDVLTVPSEFGYELIRKALADKNGLAAKWMPRKGTDAVLLRKHLGLSPKQYRKTLVNLTKVVETAMCSKNWDAINYSHVPSVASARYQKAFNKNDPVRYTSWKEGLKDGTTKVNASVLYPYEVLRSIGSGDQQVALAQWNALPDYCDGSSILPVVDVSGSMGCPASGSVTCMDVAVSLGLYLAERNKGAFKDTFVTFSTNPQIQTLKGDLLQKLHQLRRADWDMSTNLHAVFDQILNLALKNNAPQADMPETVLLLSDMQFNSCVHNDDSAMEMIQRKYEEAGYAVPKVIFWNLNASFANVPVAHDKSGAALVSGFSPSIMTAILASEDFSPAAIMLKAIMNPRYDF